MTRDRAPIRTDSPRKRGDGCRRPVGADAALVARAGAPVRIAEVATSAHGGRCAAQ